MHSDSRLSAEEDSEPEPESAAVAVAEAQANTEPSAARLPRTAGAKEYRSQVWVHDDEHAYALAQILDEKDDGTIVQIEGHMGDKKLPTNECYKVNPAEHDVPDNSELMYLNDASLLWNVRNRFLNDNIYTYTANILIAINPFKDMSHIYGEDLMLKYKGQSIGTLEPHVFAIADYSYRQMMKHHCVQFMIISGESGAGKTETSKIALRYLAVVGGKDDLEGHMMKSNPILEAFGNAKTLCNNNSSRFGKLMRIEFDRDNTMCSASMDTYLLEKSRIVTHAPGERAYHVFYQLCAGAPGDLKDKLRLRPADDYVYCAKRGSEHVAIEDVDDATDFDEMHAALNSCGFTPDEQNAIFQITAGILHLGNVEFISNGPEDRYTGGGNAELANPECANVAAEMFYVDPAVLRTKMVTRLVNVRSEQYEQPKSPRVAECSRDALAKATYSRMFDFLVDRVNDGLSARDPSTLARNAINVLDIYGFEFFEINSFEQLCINYANEKLQRHFNVQVLSQEKEIYRKEAIKVAEIHYRNRCNEDYCIDLLDGVFSDLDAECRMPRPTDKSYIQKLHSRRSRHPSFEAPEMRQECGRNLGGEAQSYPPDEAFTIKHFAGDVTYVVEGFVDKNMDPLDDDVEKMMFNSSLGLLHDLFPYEDPSLTRGGRGKKKRTVGGHFCRQLGVLAGNLDDSTSHFIRCIKPNNAQQPGIFEGVKVDDQLRCSGIMEVLHLMHQGYPTRYRFDDLYGRYKDLMPEEWSDLAPNDFVECLLQALEVPRDKYQLGLTKVFFKAGQFAPIDEYFTNERRPKVPVWAIRCRCARVIQATCRGWTERANYLKATKGYAILTRYTRRFLQARNAAPLIAELAAERKAAAEKQVAAEKKAVEKATAEKAAPEKAMAPKNAASVEEGVPSSTILFAARLETMSKPQVDSFAERLGLDEDTVLDVAEDEDDPKAFLTDHILRRLKVLGKDKFAALKKSARDDYKLSNEQIKQAHSGANDKKAAVLQLIFDTLATGVCNPEVVMGSPGGAPALPVSGLEAPAGVLDKYVAADQQIRLGRSEDSTHGVEVLLGLSDDAMAKFYQDPVGMIQAEFALHGSADDKENLRCALNGTKKLGWSSGVSLDVLLAHPNAKVAKLQRHHVLALRLYTTCSYCRINDPLRKDPPQRPHPFAATTFSVDKGIKLLRAVAASLPNAHTAQVYWRGMKDLGLTMEFLQKGGTEFACLSTSASQQVAVQFAASYLPLVFKFETKDFTSRGADIAWLSVYPGEAEALYPPLTYLRSIKAENELIGEMTVLVATVEPVFM